MKDKEDTRQGFESRACFDFNTTLISPSFSCTQYLLFIYSHLTPLKLITIVTLASFQLAHQCALTLSVVFSTVLDKDTTDDACDCDTMLLVDQMVYKVLTLNIWCLIAA